jgi:hypothetical protein
MNPNKKILFIIWLYKKSVTDLEDTKTILPAVNTTGIECTQHLNNASHLKAE